MNAKLKPVEQQCYAKEEIRDIRQFFSEMLYSGANPARIAANAGITVDALATFQAGTLDVNTLDLKVVEALDDLYCHIDGESENTDMVMMPSTKLIIQAFDRARAPRLGMQFGHGQKKRGIALIYGCSGVGKSIAAEWYAEQNNLYQEVRKIPVVLVEVDGSWKTRKAMLEAVVKGISLVGVHRTYESSEAAIIDAVPYGGLLIFDQAHRLPAARMDELCIFPDRHSIGVAFMGNLLGHTEYVRRNLDQIARRVAGEKVLIEIPTEDDVYAILAHHKISGQGIVDISLKIGVRVCGVDDLTKTIHAAKQIAMVQAVPVDLEIFKSAAVRVAIWSKAA